MSGWIAVFTGTREELTDEDRVRVSDAVRIARHQGATIFVGDAKGVDAIVRLSKGADGRVFSANWHLEGKSAGPKRNRRMLEAALQAVQEDASRVRVYGFPSKASRGTWDCIKQGVRLGCTAYVCPVETRFLDRRENR